MIISRTFNTVTGSNQVINHVLFGVRIMGVKREGVQHKQVTPFVANQPEFFYFAGRIIFDTQFPFQAGERVWVMWKT